jgi:hypothetical protein
MLEAIVLGMCSSTDEGLLESLLSRHVDEGAPKLPTPPPDAPRVTKKFARRAKH